MNVVSARGIASAAGAFTAIASLLWPDAVCAAPELAAVHCAHDAAELAGFLSDVSNGGTANGHDNVIRLVAGTFAANGATFSFNSHSGFALTLDGGYDFNCITQDLTPGKTVLDGGGPGPGAVEVLSLQSSGDVTVSRLTIQHGFKAGSSNGGGAGIYLANASAIAVFDDNQVLNNSTDYAAGGLSIFGTGTVHIDGNLFAGNSAPSVAAVFADMNAGSMVYLNNNTITGNINSTVGPAVSALGPAGHVANNISYANTGSYDFYLYANGTIGFVDNDYHSISGTPAAGGHGNVDVNPLFAGIGNYRLAADSPLRASGTASAAGSLPAADLDGHAFPLAGKVDVGAWNETLFADGFDVP
jgi:hypothetical protein